MRERKALPAGFAAAVLAWVNAELVREGVGADPAVTLTACSMYGTDWAGDTDGGFYSEHELTLEWVTTTGKTCRQDISGDAMESLWNAVVAAWPDDEKKETQ